MKQSVKVLSVIVVSLLLCVQAGLAYDFVGTPIELEDAGFWGFPADIGSFMWLPDGEHMLFVWENVLYKISVEDEGIEEVCNLLEEIDSGSNIEITQVNTIKIRLFPNSTCITLAVYTNNGVYIINFDFEDFETTVLSNQGIYPAWSQDGRYLLYRDSSASISYIYDSTTGEKTIFEFPDSYSSISTMSATFDPNSEYIYYCQMYDSESSGESMKYTINRIPVEGGDPEILTDKYFNYGVNLHFSENGRLLMYDDLSDVLILDTLTGAVYNALTGEVHTETREQPTSGNYSNHTVEEAKLIYNGVEVDPDKDMYFKNYMSTFSPDGTQFVYYIDTVETDYKKVYIVDFNASLYTGLENKDLPMAVEDNQPEAFATLSNFPNPFNPSTTIEFSLPKAGNAKLVIYDITGRKVRELADGVYSAGTHSIQWDARDDAGNPVSSGVYMSRLTAGDATVNSRMTYVR